MGRFRIWMQEKGGHKKVGAMLNKKLKTTTGEAMAYNWWARSSCPRALTMRELVKMGRGAFSYEDIINDTEPLKNKTKRKAGRDLNRVGVRNA